MSYDTMPAGREMDALVAEKVMGKGETKTIGGIYCGPPEGEAEAMAKLHADTDKVPRYSTDIAAAWEVVQKAADVTVAKEREFKNAPWNVVLHFHDRKGQGFGHTTPLAICRAALKAMDA
jgi:hypothetical protein